MVSNMFEFGNVYFDMSFMVVLEHQCSRVTTPWGTRKWQILKALQNLHPDLLVPMLRPLNSV